MVAATSENHGSDAFFEDQHLAAAEGYSFLGSG